MSFVWATVALLVLLLPGFTYVAGQFFSEGFTRETVPRSPVWELAVSLLVSFTVHGILYLWLRDKIDMEVLLSILQVEAAEASTLPEIANRIKESAGRIVLYVLGTSAIGFMTGWLQGKTARWPIFRGFVQHPWVFELLPKKKRGYVYAYVMTYVQAERNRVLMYRGVLEQFALAKDGTFSYLVLRQPTRYYMHFHPRKPLTSPSELWHEIGADAEHGSHERRTLTYLVVEGEDIANVVFDRVDFRYGDAITSIGDLLNDEVIAEIFGIPLEQVVFTAEAEEEPEHGEVAQTSEEGQPAGMPRSKEHRKDRS